MEDVPAQTSNAQTATRPAPERPDAPPSPPENQARSNAAPPATQPVRPNSIATGFVYKTIQIGAETHAYCVYVPPTYDPTRAWPVILFLHGSGECGSDGFLQT